jgi:peptidoglycan/LPS O-acetylase OafA/YrhL
VPKAEVAGSSRPRGYLLEVQGLRTAAALLVAIYHIWLGRVSGGVDVFFVVAAYFMISGLLRREPVGIRQIGDYYASTLKRVVPGAALVVAATVAASLLFLPRSEWAEQLSHALASLAFLENWRLVASGADYLQRALGASPFQQMWALALQMQVYLVFPLIFGVASLAGRWIGGVRPWATALFSLGFILSLLFSLALTRTDQPNAYFNSLTRVWEFAAGALLALTIDRIRLPVWVASLLGWLGLAVLIGLGVTVDVSRQFPGYLAALPVFSAMAIIIGSYRGANNPILANRAMTGLADLSFAFYLWHWPLLVLLRYQLGTQHVGLYGIVVLAGALGLAYLSTRFVESPLRRWRMLEGRFWASVGVAALAIALSGGAIASWYAYYQSEMTVARQQVAQLLADPSMPIPRGETIPTPMLARDDNPPGYAKDGCHQNQNNATAKSCVFGDENAATIVMLVGGSHALQWLPALDAVGREAHFKVISVTKSACLLTTASVKQKSCGRWNANVLKLIDKLKPDLLVTTATRPRRKGSHYDGDYVPAGYVGVWNELARRNVNVLAIRDNPWFASDALVCVETYAPPWSECQAPFVREASPEAPYALLNTPNVAYADYTDLLCDEFCSPVRDGVLAYRDRHHLNKTFVLLHKDRLAASVLPLLAIPLSSAPAKPVS